MSNDPPEDVDLVCGRLDTTNELLERIADSLNALVSNQEEVKK